MIVLGKDKTLDNYFIDENGVITDQFGNVQKVGGKIRPYFKGVGVHQIQMWTNFGWRDGHKWAIHHLDENKLNNSLSNLVFLTRSEHMKLHKKGKELSEEHRRNISKNHFDCSGKHHPLYGKTHSEESKRKMKLSHAGQLWFNDGVKNYRCKECPPGCVKGRLKINRNK